MAIHRVTVVAFNEGVETYRNTVKGRKHKRQEMINAMKTISTQGEIHTTEEGAEAWVVWSYKAGDTFTYRSGTIPK